MTDLREVRVVETYPLFFSGGLAENEYGELASGPGEPERMFLRKMRRRKDGKVHTYWALVESVRTARGPRQRVVAHLGELSPGGRVGFQRLGQELERRDGAGQLVLYEANPVPEWVRVDASRVAVERVLSPWHPSVRGDQPA